MLRKLIDGLLVTVADFCYEPDDFELWKSCFVPSDNGVNIFSYRANILQEMQKNVYYYKMGDKLVRLPNSYFMKLRKLLVSSFEILDLLNHDKEQ